MVESPVTSPPAFVLTPSDRCDRCCARAQVRWVRGEQVIDTCAHHARVHSQALLDWASYLIDRRDKEEFADD